MERFNGAYRVWQPMKYATAKTKEILNDALHNPNYGLQLKKDGASYVWTKDLDGSVHLYGSRISKKTGEVIDKIENTPHLKEFAEEYFPNGSQLCVEICYCYNAEQQPAEKSNSKFVNSIMLSKPEKAIARQEATEFVEAYIFDILYWNGKNFYDEDCIDRLAQLKNIEIEWENKYSVHPYTSFFTEHPWLSFVHTFNNTDSKIQALATWLNSGEEGGVLKLLTSTEKISATHAVTDFGSTARRPMHTTYKIKQIDTVDVVITGIEYPTKEYTGKDPEHWQYRDDEGNPVNRLWALEMFNAFEIGAYNDRGELIKIGTVASGLTDEMRGQTEPPIGEVIEIECMSKDNEAKSLRHPRFIRFREDKNPKDCLLNEIFS